MVDNLIGLLANFFQVAFVIAAFLVFLLPHRIKERIAGAVNNSAALTAAAPWFRWIQHSSKATHRYLLRLYGPRTERTSTNLYGLLSDHSFRISLQISGIYLVLGVPAFASCAILVGSANPTATPLFRAYAALFVLSTAIAIALAWRGIRKTSDYLYRRYTRFQALLQAGAYTVLLPTIGTGFSPISDPQSKAGSAVDLASMWWVFPTVLLTSLLYLRAIKVMSQKFGFTVPFWLLAYIVVSFPMGIIGSSIGAGFPSSIQNKIGLRSTIDFWDILSVVIILLAAHLRFTSRPQLIRVLLLAAATVLALPVAQQAKGAFQFGTDFLLKPDIQGIPPLAFYLVLCTSCATMVGLVYSNALCDWISVATTRLFLAMMSRSASVQSFIAWFLIDVLIAALLVATAYAIFIALSHLYLSASFMPLEEALQALRTAPLKYIGVQRAGDVSFSSKFGTGLGDFVLLFALTALVPSMIHAALLLFSAFAKLILPLLSIPAGWLVERYLEGHKRGESSFLRIQDAVIFASIVIGLLVLYVAHKVVNHILVM